ncbi:MAG TPA: universal stress protein [Syntrophales bacterium]|nr:universal stress protein [Syntrophales bacterium]
MLTRVPHEEILKFQQDNNIGLIVIGTNSRKAAGAKEVFGSTADRLVKYATCPVLTVISTGEEVPESKDPKLCSDGEIRF